MERKPDKNKYFIVRVTDRDKNVVRGTIGRQVGRDDVLKLIRILENLIAIRVDDLILLNGQFGSAGDNIQKVLDLFLNVYHGDPPHLYQPACEKLLKTAQKNLPYIAARELKMATDDLNNYFSDKVNNYKSAEYFLQHCGNALLYTTED